MSRHASNLPVLAALLLPLLLGGAAPAAGHIAAGDRLASRGAYEQAIEHYTAAAAAEPWRSAPRLRAGALHLRWGVAAAAAQEYEAALSLHPGSPSAWLGLGRALAAQGEVQAAANALARAADLHPEAQPAYEAGLLHLETADLAAAMSMLNRAAATAATRNDPTVELEARLRLALLESLADPAAGEAHLVRAAELAPAGAAGRVEAARAAVREAMEADDPVHRAAVLGRGALNQGLTALAEALLRRALVDGPAYVDAQAYLALALLARGRADDARQVAEQALSLEGSHVVARYTHAASLRATGQLLTAIAELKELVASVPTEPAFLLELAAACADFGDYEAAAGYAKAAAQTDAGAVALLAVARFHLDRAFQPEEAVGWTAQALLELPDDAEAWESHGWALQMLGRYAEARPALERAVALDPLAPSAHYRLAVAHEVAGSLAEARTGYARAADLDTAGPYGRKAREALAVLATLPD